MPLRPCIEPQCPELTTGTRCKAHQRAVRRWERSRQPYAAGYGNPYRRGRRAAMARSGGVCEGCGREPAVEVHHKVPLSKGGTNLSENLIALGRRCHREAHRHKGRRSG